MAEPFIGEIKMAAWNYPPRGWAFCNGAILSIATNQALFALLGTTYGGDGVRTFALPDLRGRVPMSVAPSSPIGVASGEELHVLSLAETPQHTHVAQATATTGTAQQFNAGDWLGAFPNGYGALPDSGQSNLDPSDVTSVGNGAAHENRQPFLCINFIIALVGIFPPRN